MMLSKAMHLLVSLNRRIRLSRWIPLPLMQGIRGRAMRHLVEKLPDRVYLEQQILPCFARQPWKKILFVGCESFTQHYGRQFANGSIEFWTADIKPASAIWGEPGRHLTCDVCKLDQYCSHQDFDAILLNGVFGFGVNSMNDMEAAIRAIHRVLKPSGLLLLGWNRDLIPDPCELESVQQGFRHETSLALAVRTTFVEVTHTFDFLTAR